MPITRGSGNPVWTWDETIVALDLLYRHGKPVDKGHTDILQLSNLLRSATIYPLRGRKENFRNADGVALKLQNLFAALMPGRGLSSSFTDRKVVEAFPLSDRNKLAEVAAQIRLALETDFPVLDIPEDEVFVEGRVITAKHRFRDRRLRLKLLASKGHDQLICEICSFSPPPIGRDLQESFLEAHHVVPLAAAGSSNTRLSDMALLCAGCHRFIHKLISRQQRWVGVSEAKSILRRVQD